jgi:hypothetical protein
LVVCIEISRLEARKRASEPAGRAADAEPLRALIMQSAAGKWRRSIALHHPLSKEDAGRE